MNLHQLKERYNVLSMTLEKAKKEIIECTERLELAKNNFATLSGHCNELSFICSQMQSVEEGDNDKIDDTESKKSKKK